MVGQAVVTADSTFLAYPLLRYPDLTTCVPATVGNTPVGVLWFAIIVQTFLILGLIFSLESDTIHTYRNTFATFSSIVVVFAVIGVDRNIYFPLDRAERALSAGWLITAMVDLLWVGYFTLEADSEVLKFVDQFGGGQGGITGARARRVTVGQVGPPEIGGERGPPVQNAFGDLGAFRYPPPRSLKSSHSQDEGKVQGQRESGGSGPTAVDEQVAVLFTVQALYSCEFRFCILFGKVLI